MESHQIACHGSHVADESDDVVGAEFARFDGPSEHPIVDRISVLTSERISSTQLRVCASQVIAFVQSRGPMPWTVAQGIIPRCGDVRRSWYAEMQHGSIAHAIRTPVTLDPAEATNLRGLRAMITEEDCQWIREYAERHRHVSGVTTRLAYESLRYKRPESKATRSEVGQFMTANNLCTELHRCLGKVRRNRGSGQGTAT